MYISLPILGCWNTFEDKEVEWIPQFLCIVEGVWIEQSQILGREIKAKLAWRKKMQYFIRRAGADFLTQQQTSKNSTTELYCSLFSFLAVKPREFDEAFPAQPYEIGEIRTFYAISLLQLGWYRLLTTVTA